MHSRIGKRGEGSLALFTLLEIVLAVMVIFTLWYVVHGIVDDTTFFQSFYAKDNAHIAEALHAVPNGAMDVAYLWKSDQFALILDDSYASVALVKDGRPLVNSQKTKYFGMSNRVEVLTADSFMPQYYAYRLSHAGLRTVSIQQNVNAESCTSTTIPLTGLQVRGVLFGDTTLLEQAQNTVSDDAATLLAQQLYEEIRVHKPDLTQIGPQITLVLEQGTTNEVGVYYTNYDEQSRALFCLVRSKVAAVSAVRAGHVSAAPSAVQAQQGTLLIHVRVSDPASAQKVRAAVAQGVLAYWGAS